MRKRVVGAGLLVAIGIGIWLGRLFKGLGPGGEQAGIGPSENVTASLERSSSSVPNGEQDQSTVAAQASRHVPTVLIDGHQYLLQMGSGPEENFRPSELSEIVRLARRSRPGEDGIRVHIKRRQSSRASAENALDEALRQAGIEPQAIQRHSAFVD